MISPNATSQKLMLVIKHIYIIINPILIICVIDDKVNVIIKFACIITVILHIKYIEMWWGILTFIDIASVAQAGTAVCICQDKIQQ